MNTYDMVLYWKSQYLIMEKEVRKSQKGISRLKKREKYLLKCIDINNKFHENSMTIQYLHKKALEIVDVAFINNFNGNEDIAIAKFKEALDFEKEAAFLAKQENIGEPSESILFRSAAAIALNAKEFRIAEKLVAFGLSGDPPFEIAEELRNLLEDIHCLLLG